MLAIFSSSFYFFFCFVSYLFHVRPGRGSDTVSSPRRRFAQHRHFRNFHHDVDFTFFVFNFNRIESRLARDITGVRSFFYIANRVQDNWLQLTGVTHLFEDMRKIKSVEIMAVHFLLAATQTHTL